MTYVDKAPLRGAFARPARPRAGLQPNMIILNTTNSSTSNHINNNAKNANTTTAKTNHNNTNHNHTTTTTTNTNNNNNAEHTNKFDAEVPGLAPGRGPTRRCAWGGARRGSSNSTVSSEEVGRRHLRFERRLRLCI